MFAPERLGSAEILPVSSRDSQTKFFTGSSSFRKSETRKFAKIPPARKIRIKKRRAGLKKLYVSKMRTKMSQRAEEKKLIRKITEKIVPKIIPRTKERKSED